MNRSNTRWFRTAASSLLLGFLVTLAIGTAAAVEPKGARRQTEIQGQHRPDHGGDSAALGRSERIALGAGPASPASVLACPSVLFQKTKILRSGNIEAAN